MRDKGIVLVVALILFFSGWQFYQYEKLGGTSLDVNDEIGSASLPDSASDDSALQADVSEIQKLGERYVPFLVEDQFVGSIVSITDMSLPEDSWAAVHSNKNDMPGNVLGVRFFSKETKSGEIELAVPMKAGNKYFVVLHGDNGTRKWSNENPMMKDSDGQIIMGAFTVTEE